MSIIQNMSIKNFIFDFDKREDYIIIINNNNTTTNNNEKIFYIYLAAAVAIFVSSAVRIG